jgi:hypothetical protein
VFPQAYGVTPLANRFDPAWTALNRWAPGWANGHDDPYPWAILGYVAALRGQTALARRQIATVEQRFASEPALVTINELGFYHRTRTALEPIAKRRKRLGA